MICLRAEVHGAANLCVNASTGDIRLCSADGFWKFCLCCRFHEHHMYGTQALMLLM